MGLTLSKHASERIAAAAQLDRLRHPEKYAPVPARLTLFVHGDPPTTTHHDKRIEKRGRRLCLVDTPRLRAARDHYFRAIPERNGPPIAGPVLARLTFCWGDGAMGVGDLPRWMEQTPDADNAAKAVLDAVAERRWIQNDSKVARLVVMKAFVQPHHAGVHLQLETLLIAPPLAWEPAPLKFELIGIGGGRGE